MCTVEFEYPHVQFTIEVDVYFLDEEIKSGVMQLKYNNYSVYSRNKTRVITSKHKKY